MVSGFGQVAGVAESNLLFNDYHWDNNQDPQPSLLSRGKNFPSHKIYQN